MNLKNIEELIQNQQIRKTVMKIIEFEQSQLHRDNPWYKKVYDQIIQEALNENKQN